MELEKVVGQRIYDARDAAKMTQAELGRRLGPLLGRPWSRQQVSAAEQGGRDFRIAELIAIAHVLGVQVTALVRPGPELAGQEVELPGERAMSRQELLEAVLAPVTDLESDRGRVLVSANELTERIADMRVRALETDQAADRAFAVLARLLGEVQELARQVPEDGAL